MRGLLGHGGGLAEWSGAKGGAAGKGITGGGVERAREVAGRGGRLSRSLNGPWTGFEARRLLLQAQEHPLLAVELEEATDVARG